MAWFPLAPLALAVQVQGATTCPLPSDVEARLAELLPGSTEGAPTETDVAELIAEDDALVLSLRSADGAAVSLRRFPRTHACDELAAAAAVAIATWQSDVHPAYAAPGPVRISRAAEPRTPRLEPRRFPSMRAGVQGGGLTSGSAGGLAAAVVAHASLQRPAWPFGVRLSGSWQGARSREVGAGEAAWRRLALGLGIDLHRPWSADPAWSGGLAASVLAGRLTVGGQGFERNLEGSSWEPGYELSLAVGRALGIRGLFILVPSPSTPAELGGKGSDLPDADGQRLDLESVYRRHAADVSRWAQRLGGPGMDPEDLVHDVFLIVQRRLPEWEGKAKLSTWLYEITIRVVQERRRSMRRRRLLWPFNRGADGDDWMDRFEDGRPSPLDDIEQRQATALLYRLLDGIDEKYRTPLVLFEVEGLSCQEIATLTNVTVQNVWVRLSRGREKLARAFVAFQAREGRP